MNVHLGKTWEEFIAANVDSGRYLSASEVVREALRLLQEREQIRQIRLEELRSEVKKGITQLDSSDALRIDENGLKEYLGRVKERGRKHPAHRRADVE